MRRALGSGGVGFFRVYSSTQSLSTQSALTVTTWLPSKRDKANNRTSMDAVSAKEARIENTAGYRFDVYGHARAQLVINLQDKGISSALADRVSEIADQNGHDSKGLTSVEAYVSWIPGGAISEEKTADELKELSDFDTQLGKEDGALSKLNKQLFKDFLGHRYPARNSVLRSDELKYGIPEPSRVIRFEEIDFLKVFNKVSEMMDCSFENGKLIMNKVKPGLKYSGLDLLRTRQELLGIERTGFSTVDHTCTTAVMKLLRSGLGEEVYMEAARRVLSKNTGRLHDIPLIEFMHDLSKEMHLMTQSLPDSAHVSVPSFPH